MQTSQPLQDDEQQNSTPFDARLTPDESNEGETASTVPLPSYDDDLGLVRRPQGATSVHEPVAAPAPAATFYATNARADRRASPASAVAANVTPDLLPVAPSSTRTNYVGASTRVARHTQLLESIDVLSAFRIGILVSAFTWSIMGLFLMILPVTMGVSLAALTRVGGASGASGVANGSDIGSALVSYLFSILLVGIVAGAACGLGAWGYNIIAAAMGGLEVEVTQSETE